MSVGVNGVELLKPPENFEYSSLVKGASKVVLPWGYSINSCWREGHSNTEPFRGTSDNPRQDCLAGHRRRPQPMTALS